MGRSEEMGEKLIKNLAKEKENAEIKKSLSPKNRDKKKIEKQERLKRFGWICLAMSVLGLFWFFIGSFAGKFWFKVFLSVVIGFVIGKKPDKWRWRILIFIFVSLTSMIYTGETTELFRYAILATGVSAWLLFGFEELCGWNIYPRGMLHVFVVIVVICVGLLLGDLFSDHSKIANKYKVPVSDLQKKAEIEKKVGENFSNGMEIKIPESLFSISILKKEEEPFLLLWKDWLFLKIKNGLPAEYSRVNNAVRMALFVIFLFVVHAVYIPVGSLEAAKDYLKRREEKGKGKKEPIGENRISYWFIERAWEQLVNIMKKRKK